VMTVTKGTQALRWVKLHSYKTDSLWLRRKSLYSFRKELKLQSYAKKTRL
jgi:hypothetical protein